jgi:hypothetical protein
VKTTIVPRILHRDAVGGLAPDERRLVEERVDAELNIALKMSNDERVAKYGVRDMKNIHAKLQDAERARVISIREKKMKAVCPVRPAMTKIVSPHQLIKEFLRNSPVQIIRPKKTIAELAAEERPAPPKLPVAPKGGVYDRIAKKAGMRIAKPKQTKVVKEKPPIPLYDKARCSKKTSNKPYTVSDLRRMAKAMGIPKSKIVEAKSSVKKLCDLVENKKNGPAGQGENESMKRRIEHAKAVLRRNKSTPPKNKSTPPENKLKQMGFNLQRIGRKSKANPDPHTHNNLMKIARELHINIPTTSKKPKPTATQLIEFIKKTLGKA